MSGIQLPVALKAAANAAQAEIARAQVAVDFKEQLGATRIVRQQMPESAFNWMAARVPCTLKYQGNNTTHGDHAALQAMRELCTNFVEQLLFSTDPATGHRRLKGGSRVLFVGATSKEIKAYSVPGVSFWCPLKESRDVDRMRYHLNLVVGSYSTVQQALESLRLPGVFFDDPVGQFDVLVTLDSAYNITPTVWWQLMRRTGAREVLGMMFMPPELMFDDMPANPIYRTRFVERELRLKAPRKIRELVRARHEAYVDATAVLRNKLNAVYPGATLQYEKCDEYSWHVARYADGTEIEDINIANALEHSAPMLANSRFPDLDKKWEDLLTALRNVENPTWQERLENKFDDVVAWIDAALFRPHRARWLRVTYRCEAGAGQIGYEHDADNWARYFEPGWNVPSHVISDGLRNEVVPAQSFVLERKLQMCYMHVWCLTRAHVGGTLPCAYTLPDVDRYVYVLDVMGTYQAWRGGFGKFVYKSYRRSDVDPVFAYVMSLLAKQIDDPDAEANVSLYIRRTMTMAQYTAMEGHSVSLILRDEYTTIAVAAVMYAKYTKSLISEIKSRTTGLLSRFVGAILGIFDGTALADFFHWLFVSKWSGKVYIPGPSERDLDVTLLDPVPVEPWSFQNDVPKPQSKAPEEPHVEGDVPVHCVLCEVFSNCGYPKESYKCQHRNSVVEWKLTEAQMKQFHNELREVDLDPEGIARVKTLANDVVKRRLQEQKHLVPSYFLLGLPGTGKTYTILSVICDYVARAKAVGKSVKVLVALPFNKLASEYENVKFKYAGQTYDLSDVIVVKTVHRAIAEPPLGYAAVFVDELGALDMKVLTMLAHAHKGADFFLAGDPNQTQLLQEEGDNVFDYLRETEQPFEERNVHTLLWNRRNPESAVVAANKFIDPKYGQMVAKSGRTNPIRVVTDKAQLERLAPNWKKYYKMSFSHRGWAENCPSEKSDRPEGKIKGQTVRSSQGLTRDNVLLYVTKHCHKRLLEDCQSLVALTRHRYDLVIYVTDQTSGISAWLERFGMNWMQHIGADVPAVGHVLAAEIEEREPIEGNPRPSADASRAHMHVSDLDLATGEPLPEKIAASLLPKDKKFKDFETNDDCNAALGSNGLVDRRVTAAHRLVDGYANIDQLSGQRNTEYTALVRQGQQMRQVDFTEDLRSRWTPRLNALVSLMRFEVLDPIDEMTVILEALRDGHTRNYQGRAYAEDVDPMMIMADITHLEATLGRMTIERAKQRVTQKMDTKIVNQQKAAGWDKVGQALASLPAKSIAATYVKMRLMGRAVFAAFKNTFVSIKHYVTDEQFERDADRRLNEMKFPDRVYLDGTATDAGATRASSGVTELFVEMCMKKSGMTYFAQSSNGRRELFSIGESIALCRQTDILCGALKWRAGYATPTGATDTYFSTTVYVLLAAFVMYRPEGPRTLFSGGDDASWVAAKLIEEPKGAKLVRDTCNIEFTAVRQTGAGTMEFCGSLFCFAQDGSFCTQNLVRRVRKVFGSLYKDDKHYGEAMVSVRDWVKRHSGAKGAQLLRAAAYTLRELSRRNANGDLVHPMDMSAAYVLAQEYFEALDSASKLSWKDFLVLAKKYTFPAHPLLSTGDAMC